MQFPDSETDLRFDNNCDNDQSIHRGKRDKSKKIKGDEFVVVSTGEVLPLQEFIPWCQREKILETILAPEGAQAPPKSDEVAQEDIE